MIHYEPGAIESIDEVAEAMVAIAQRREDTVEANFHGVLLWGNPLRTKERILEDYYSKLSDSQRP